MLFLCQIPRSVIRLGGADRYAFLQGLVSNDVALCVPEQAIFAGLLTPQGKFLHDIFIVDQGEDFLIDCEAARADDLLRRFAAHKLRAKITLENAAAEFDVWAAWNAPPPNAPGVYIYADPRLPELGARMIVKKGVTPKGERVPFEAYDRHRRAHGGTDRRSDLIVEKSTLAEGNFDFLNGISWTKGCYMGQELTARLHYRGLVKKRLFPVRIEGAAPAFGAAVKFGTEDVGDMRSSCGDLGLALLNVEKAGQALRVDTPLTSGENWLRVYRVGWMGAEREAG
jgi:folate-binding protein YgfZ